MVPSLPGRTIRLYPPILDRHPIPDPILQHRYPEQPSHLLALLGRLSKPRPVLCCETVVVDQAQGFAGITHAVVLALEGLFLGVLEVALVKLPGAVDSPVAEVAGAVKT